MGKGSRSRVSDAETYRRNYDRIFRRRKGKRGNDTGNEKGTPGSSQARANGCVCAVVDNNHGRGCEYGPGVFWIRGDCPVHGNAYQTLKTLTEACGYGKSVDKPRKPNTIRGAHKIRRAD